jgi:lysophospholipase L1-like esterase
LAALALLVPAGVLLVQVSRGQSGFFFRNNDSPVVVLGDSITQDGGYVLMIESFLLTRFPSWNVSIRNLGISGDTAGLRRRGGLRKTIERDIDVLKPGAALVCFGMNDGREAEDRALYEDRLDRLVTALTERGARVAVLSPTIEEGETAGWLAGSRYNTESLALLAWSCRKIAKERGAHFVDLFAMMAGAVEGARHAGAVPLTGERALVPDKVHPGVAGHFLMASTILKELGASGFVSEATVDAVERRVTAGKGCSVEVDLSAGPGEVAFTRYDQCLPWPVPGEALLVAKKVPGFEHAYESLSVYTLKVTGLQPRTRYTLAIDDIAVAEFDGATFGEGINLSSLPGPIRHHCDKLYGVLEKKHELWRKRYKEVQLYQLPAWARPTEANAEEAFAFAPVAEWLEARRRQEQARLDAEIRELETEARALRKPGSRRFSIRESTATLARPLAI